MLNQQLREIKVLCEPSKIPEFIEVDVTNLETGEFVHVFDLKVAEGVEILELPESVVVSIVVVKEEELEPQTEATAEPAIVGKEGEETEN